MALSELQFISEAIPDARIIEICREMLAVHQEIDDLVDQDPYAPDCGPNYARHEALWEKFRALADQLTETAVPTTPDGIQALARLASLFFVRTSEGSLQRPGCFGEWLRLLVLTSAAGKPEQIPLPPP